MCTNRADMHVCLDTYTQIYTQKKQHRCARPSFTDVLVCAYLVRAAHTHIHTLSVWQTSTGTPVKASRRRHACRPTRQSPAHHRRRHLRAVRRAVTSSAPAVAPRGPRAEPVHQHHHFHHVYVHSQPTHHRCPDSTTTAKRRWLQRHCLTHMRFASTLCYARQTRYSHRNSRHSLRW